MAAILADTHAAIWHMVEPAKLSTDARSALLAAAQAGDPVFLSAISLVEIRYLIEKGKVIQSALDLICNALDDPAAALTLAPLDYTIAKAVQQIPRTTVPDMPDRIIAATALALNVPLVSRDRKIQASSIVTIW